MKASVLKTEQRKESRNDRSLGIQTYGENNDYPQRCKEISDASGTAKACIDKYAKFIAGRGFSDKDFYQTVINCRGHTSDYLLNQIARDFADYGGFAIHVNYNALYEIVELQHIPFEGIRFGKLDDDGNFNQVAIHPDWARRNQALRRFKKEDIVNVSFFDPKPEVIQQQVDDAGGWDKYTGQLYYYSSGGDKVYPKPVYDSVLTDMSTEEGISNVKSRNARNNFLPAGMIIDKRNRSASDEQENNLENVLAEFQGDEVAGKLVYVEVESEEEIPEFKPFDTRNFDKEFDYSEKSVQSNIGKAFSQPPILRAENMGTNFGADLMKNAYAFYNSITEPERICIERVFSEIFTYWYNQGINPANDYTIRPLEYTYGSTDISKIPADVLAVMTINEKRALVGLPELTGNN